MIERLATPIPGCWELRYRSFEDDRGRFVKTFHRDAFAEAGLETDFAEEYYSLSHQGVLRGLHFQTPPKDHVKLVYAIAGKALDAVLDLRVGSPTYGRYHVLELSAASANALYVPRGLAHGFYVPEGEAVMVYKVTSVHSPVHDHGICWNSAGIPWPDEAPILSERDRGFPALPDFVSPFRYEPEA